MQAAKWMVAAVGMVAALWAGGQAHASLVEALDLSGLVARADEVVLAQVIDSESHFDERGRIVTDTRMQVEQSEKGSRVPGSVVIVRRLGGVVGDLGMQVAGEGSYKAGERLLGFFSYVGGPEVMRTVGMSQGALRIREENGVRWVQSVPAGAALVKRSNGGKLAASPAAVAEPRKLDDVLSEVRALVAKAK
jgi:hypothetical protein